MTDEQQKPKTAIDELAELEKAYEVRLSQIAVDAAKSGGSYTLELMTKINGADGKPTNKLTFRAPTLREIRAQGPSDEQKGNDLTEDELFCGALCGLSPEGMLQLAGDDSEAVKWVIRGFRLRRAGGGPPQKAG